MRRATGTPRESPKNARASVLRNEGTSLRREKSKTLRGVEDGRKNTWQARERQTKAHQTHDMKNHALPQHGIILRLICSKAGKMTNHPRNRQNKPPQSSLWIASRLLTGGAGGGSSGGGSPRGGRLVEHRSRRRRWRCRTYVRSLLRNDCKVQY